MFDSQSHESGVRPLQAVSIGHLAREARWGLDAPRSYLVPVLFWFTCGQGRMSVNGAMRGYSANNAIFLPANTFHSCEPSNRTQGTALFFGGRNDLSGPSDTLHLRLTSLQDQTEMNQLVESFRRDCTSDLPMADEVQYHRASLILLWLAQKRLAEQGTDHKMVLPDINLPIYKTRG